MSIQELQTSRLDINNNYEIDVTLKQLDDIVLKIVVYDKSLPADLSNYTARLKAFKSDQVPLIQNTQIYINNNEVTIIGDHQLGTTSGVVKAELQFTNKTTFEKKSSFYININVVASVLETDRGISVATCTLLKEIDNKLDQIENIGNILEDAIEVNSELKDTTIPAAHAANLELQSTIDDANISKLALDASNENATNTKNTLDALNTDAINTKNALDISKNDAETIKESLETFVSEHQDVTDISNQLNNISSQMSHMTVYIQHPPAPLVPCVCDGVTDDSIAFQAINNWLSLNGGGEMRLPRSQSNILLLNQEIDLQSNVSIKGYGWSSKIKTTVGSSGNGLNILKAFEKSNITISKINIENLGYGKSGTWTPAGTFDGVGACILAVGCNNFVVDRCNVLNGGGYNGGEGVGNVYFSCCTNSKIIDNYVSLCDNGICVDSWYNQLLGKELFINDGVVINGNTVSNGNGRGIVIENRSNTLAKGSITVIGNTINKMAYAGIQGNNIFNCVITGNAIDGDQTGRSYGNSNDYMWYGMEFVSGTEQATISNNTIQNCKLNGIRCFEATDLIITSNPIKNCLGDGVFIKNTNTNMINVKVDGNIIDNVSNGIIVKADTGALIALRYNSCCKNSIRFNRNTGGIGIQFDYHEFSKCDGNTITPINTYGGSEGIKCLGSSRNTYNSNIIVSTSKGIDLLNDVDSVSDSNILENCSSAYRLDGCQKTIINSKIRGGTNAFEMVNGKTSQSQKCRALNCDITSTNIKTGNGLIVKFKSDSVPASGTWDVGDIQEYLTPTAGGSVGNTCVTSGTPGTWKSYGAISA